ncbi:hypothetical protein B9T36_10965 [Acinetobacter sp. ANC 4204]|uniref:hypothetical protein n=1 Tax=Acinetobacter sp. ANC 4204 TaxID=1977884 RepID=UPI000A33A8B1|nr:hypothetical protein [Acinetobacter sp. ANC 4204]OTG58850.1 hypothetical protein B9T36_10965 [Acinetobacter sp. ANC 4204]
MDLRDQFAMAALQGFISHRGFLCVNEQAAKRCYEIADAMIAEREKDSVDSVTDAKAQLVRAIELEHNITVSEHLCIVHLIHCLRFGFVPKKEDV